MFDLDARRTQDQTTSLTAWRALLAMFLTAAGFVIYALNSDQVGAVAVLVSLMPVAFGFALEPLGARVGWLPRRRHAVQISLDVLGIASLSLVTGSAVTAIPVFFCVPIVLSAGWLGRTEAVAAAAWAALFAVLVPLVGRHPDAAASALFVATVQAAVFLAIGLVAGGLADRLQARRRRQARAEMSMARTRSEVRNILDNLGSGLITVDPEHRITRLNPAAQRMLGLPGDEPIGHALSDVLGDSRQELVACIDAALESGRPRKRAEVEIAVGGVVVPLGLSVDFLDDGSGSVGGAVAVFTDLTEVRRMQEHLRRADRLAGVGELAASIAHEIRNPLASIRGSVEILAGELDLEGHQAQLLKLILKESGRVNKIIEDFLNFARLRPAQARALPLPSFLADIALLVRQHVTASDGAVDVQCTVDPPHLAVLADPEQLIQVLLNLAINGCEAMQYRGVLNVTARSNGDWCIIEVTDEGPGLDPEVRSQVFTPFVTTKKHGTGLGLPMVARIVHGHGGTVEANNRPQGGAIFTLRLPLAPEAAQTTPETQPATISQ